MVTLAEAAVEDAAQAEMRVRTDKAEARREKEEAKRYNRKAGSIRSQIRGEHWRDAELRTK